LFKVPSISGLRTSKANRTPHRGFLFLLKIVKHRDGQDVLNKGVTHPIQLTVSACCKVSMRKKDDTLPSHVVVSK
jgi:hypothetical protein